jgi:DNA polymerase-3 subunit beta
MRASFERSELLRVVSAATKPVESRNTIPILSNILLSVAPSADGITPGTVSVKGTDLDIVITATGPATVDTAGAVTVDAKRLEDIVRKLPASALIAIELDGTQLNVKSGRSRYKLPTLPVSDFPDIGDAEFPTTFDADVAALFKPVSFAISSEETRYYLCGVYFHEVGKKLRAVATDGHRLAQHEVALPKGAKGLAGVIVPRKAVAMIPPGVVSVSMSPTRIQFATAGLTVTSKVIDGKYPDYERIIPKDNDKVARVNRADLSAAVDRVASVVSERGRAAKFAFADGAVELSVRAEAGDAADEITVTYNSEPIEIGFNSTYMRDNLAAFEGAEVDIEMNDPGSPALFRDGGPLLCLLMPMRI